MAGKGRYRRSASMVALLVGVTLLAPAVSPANVGRRPDPRGDVEGPLDIVRIWHGHKGGGLLAHRVTMRRGWSSNALDPQRDRFIVLGFSVDGSKTIDRLVFVFWSGGLRGVVTTENGSFVGRAQVARPNARTLEVRVRKSHLNGPPGVKWFAATIWAAPGACAEACIDVAPNRALLTHDYTKPDVSILSFPSLTTEVSATTSFPVRFSVRDRGFSGLKEWRLERRVVGASSWSVVRSGRRAGTHTIDVTALQGRTYDFRVFAEDKQRNRQSRVRLGVTVPYDDGHGRFDGDYEGAWDHGVGVDGDFLGTRSQSSTAEDSFEHTFEGAYVAWIARGTGGMAEVSVDGAPPEEIVLPSSGARRLVFERGGLGLGLHTITIVVVSGDVNIDAIAIR